MAVPLPCLEAIFFLTQLADDCLIDSLAIIGNPYFQILARFGNPDVDDIASLAIAKGVMNRVFYQHLNGKWRNQHLIIHAAVEFNVILIRKARLFQVQIGLNMCFLLFERNLGLIGAQQIRSEKRTELPQQKPRFSLSNREMAIIVLIELKKK